MSDSTCRFEELDRGVLAVTLRPELNEVPWTDIERIGSGIVSRVSHRQQPRVLVDLTELSHMGSAVVALIVRVWKATGERNGKMVVVNRHELVGEVLSISGLAAKWTIVPTREEALREFSAGSGTSVSGGGGGSTAGLAATITGAVLLALAVIAVADAAAGGRLAVAAGTTRVLYGALVFAVLALAASAFGIARTFGGLRTLAVIVTVLSVLTLLAAGYFLLPEGQRHEGQLFPIGPDAPAPAAVGEPVTPAPVTPVDPLTPHDSLTPHDPLTPHDTLTPRDILTPNPATADLGSPEPVAEAAATATPVVP